MTWREDKVILSSGAVAKYCGVNLRTVIRWIPSGRLKAYPLPGRGENRVHTVWIRQGRMPAFAAGLFAQRFRPAVISVRQGTRGLI